MELASLEEWISGQAYEGYRGLQSKSEQDTKKDEQKDGAYLSFSSAGCMYLVWNAPATARRMHLALYSFAIRSTASHPCVPPETA